MLIQKPDLFLRAVAKETFGADLPKQYAVGMVFFNQDPVKAEAARENMNREILAAGLQLVGWRKVPIDTSVLGRLALERLPQIEQVFIAGDGLSDQDMAIKLSPRVVVVVSMPRHRATTSAAFPTRPSYYKGLMMPADLTAFYPDLSEERLQTAICVVPPAPFPPTPCRNGRWLSHSATSPTTARSTPSPVTVTGLRPVGPSSPMI